MNELIAVEKIAQWQKSKTLVLLRNSIGYAAGFSSIGTNL
jgi:hypothetical protein